MSKVHLIILTALLLTLAIGCTPTGGGTSNTTELEGTWKSACLYDGDSNSINTMNVNGTDVEIIFDKYIERDNTTCSTKMTIISADIDNFKVIDNSSGKFISVNFNAVYWTAVNASVVASFNSNSTCGKSDWILNDKVNVSNTNCAELGQSELSYELDGNQLTVGFLDTRNYIKQ